MIEIVAASIIAVIFLSFFGLQFYYFTQLERHYLKRRILKKLPSLNKIVKADESTNTSPSFECSEPFDSQLGSSSQLDARKLDSRQGAHLVGQQENRPKEESKKIGSPTIKIKLKMTDKIATEITVNLSSKDYARLNDIEMDLDKIIDKNEEKNDLKITSRKSDSISGRTKALKPINYSELAKLSKNILSHNKDLLLEGK